MMKNYGVMMFAILCIVTSSFGQNVPNYVPTNGLVGWWPFNGNANDESGNGNNGVVNGATLTTDRNGKSNSAYKFNKDYIFIGNNQKFDFIQELTINCWYKIDKATSNNTLNMMFVSKHLNASNQSSYVVYNENMCGPTTYFTDNSSNVSFLRQDNFCDTTNWHMLTMTYNSISLIMYLDGKNLSEKSVSTPIKKTDLPLVFGGCNNSTLTNDILGRLIGYLDDISLFNRALTQQEITSLYTGVPPCTTPNATITPQTSTTFCQGSNVVLNTTSSSNYTYQWYNNGNLINNATTSSFTASTNGNYTVAITDGACNASSQPTTVTVNSLPTATITPQGKVPFCQGSFVELLASGGTSYHWNNGSTSTTVVADKPGAYYVDVFNSFGCKSIAWLDIMVNPTPNVTINQISPFTLKNNPSIQLVGNPSGGTFSGEGISGSVFNPSNSTLGKKVIKYNYTSPQGCLGSSSISTIVVDSIGNVCSTFDTLKIQVKFTAGLYVNTINAIKFYPNPTNDILFIDNGNYQAMGGYYVKIISQTGAIVYNQPITSQKVQIAMNQFGVKGIYVAQVIDKDNVVIDSKKIVLE